MAGFSATVSRAASGKYYVSLCVEAEKESLLCANNGKQIGIDVGLKVFYSDSNGDTVENPHPLKKYPAQPAVSSGGFPERCRSR